MKLRNYLIILAALPLALVGCNNSDATGTASSLNSEARETADEDGFPHIYELSSDQVDKVDGFVKGRVSSSFMYTGTEHFTLADGRPAWDELSSTEKDILREYRMVPDFLMQAMYKARQNGRSPKAMSVEELREYRYFAQPVNVLTGKRAEMRSEGFSPGDASVRLLTDEELSRFKEVNKSTLHPAVMECARAGGLVTIYGEERVILQTVTTPIFTEEGRRCNSGYRPAATK